ncbi:MAG: hypothetical protein H0W08_10365 [Acidobacteria bacterium]|nr:hypothetical protein [Acidobacteriota bacterium]
MSGKNNVNPGQYKVAGRERQDDIAKERMKVSRQAEAGNQVEKKRPKKPAPKR